MILRLSPGKEYTFTNKKVRLTANLRPRMKKIPDPFIGIIHRYSMWGCYPGFLRRGQYHLWRYCAKQGAKFISGPIAAVAWFATYQVSNYGVSGTTMLRKGDSPYWATKEYQAALKSNPDIVFIDLGGNDSKLINRAHLNEYQQDCREMIRAFRSLPSKPRVILLQPVVSFVTDTTGIWDPVIVNQIIPQLRQVAYDENIEILDMHSLLVNKPELFPDKIHPDTKGSGIMAKRLYDQIIIKRDAGYDIFSHIKEPKQVSSFYGYPCADFTLNGRQCKVVKPKQAAKNHPWIWRARFWGHEPQTDIALLERGFHVVYCDVAELFGNKESVDRWNNFYALLQKAGLAKKAVMEGMSRGGVYVLNWAAVNPQKVACVYIDNPVLDLKPGLRD
jgi:lysophospholipase L1-like esterase